METRELESFTTKGGTKVSKRVVTKAPRGIDGRRFYVGKVVYISHSKPVAGRITAAFIPASQYDALKQLYM